MYLRFPAIQQFSFWFGFILATLLWWIITRLRPVIIKAREDQLHTQTDEKSKTKTIAAFENRYLHETLRYAQGMHLAASMFRLDEFFKRCVFYLHPCE